MLVCIYDRKYASRNDVNQFTADLYMIGNTAVADFAVIQPIISRTASPSYSPRSLNREKLLDVGDRIYKHEKDLQKTLYLINGHEDWSGLSPKPPSTPTRRNKEFPKIEKKVTFTPSTISSHSRSTRSSPSSVKATVEEVPDEGEDEDLHPVSNYHLDPVELEKKPSSPSDNKGRQEVPRVVLRQPTDPTTLQASLTPISLDDLDHAPRGLDLFGAMQIVDPPKEVNTETEGKSLRHSSLQKRTSDEILQEIRKHEEELQKMRDELNSSSSNSSYGASPKRDRTPILKNEDDPFGFAYNKTSNTGEDVLKFKTSFDSSSSSNYQSARSKTNSLDNGRPSNNSSSSLQVPDPHARTPTRQRAATFSSTESAKRPLLNADVPRPPHLSPRYSPYSSSSDYPSPRVRTSEFDSHSARNSNSSRESVYGNPHNTSLPTVLEHSAPQRNPAERGKKRASFSGGDDFNATGGDFALFDSAEPHSAQPLFKAPVPNAVAPPSNGKELPPGSIMQDLHVTLSDLYSGAKKRVPVERMLEDSMSGQLQSFMETFDVQIYPGLRPGNRVTFPGRGDWVPQLQSYGDLAFVLIEKPHELYEREGRDLIMSVEVNLYESLVGWTREIQTICGETLEVSPRKSTPVGMLVPVGSYGLPKFMGKNQQPGPRGDFLLKVNVRWPTTTFDPKQRALLRQAFGEGSRSPRV